jgi:hypothetical protein
LIIRQITFGDLYLIVASKIVFLNQFSGLKVLDGKECACSINPTPQRAKTIAAVFEFSQLEKNKK